jgi:hypothetical protein
MPLQVIGAGFGRTGTNSFQVAMEMLGLGPCHHMNVLMREPGSIDAWRRASEGSLTDWDEIYGAYTSTCDFPHCVFYAELAAFYPDAKVVLTVRDPDEWYTSAMNTIFSPENRARNRGTDAPLNPEMMGYVFKCVSRALDISNLDDKEASIAAFERHNEHVKATVPAGRLLVYEVSDGWEPLCDFLDLPVPEAAFPYTNTTEEFQGRRA